MGSLFLGGPTIQEGDGKIMMGLSIYGVGVISRSLYSRFYGMCIGKFFGTLRADRYKQADRLTEWPLRREVPLYHVNGGRYSVI